MAGVILVGLVIWSFYGPSEGKHKSLSQPQASNGSEVVKTAGKDAVEPPDGFRNLRWGSPPSASLKKFSGPTREGITMYVPVSGKTPFPIFDVPVVEELYSFQNGRFFSGSAWFDGQGNFEKVKAALLKTYGQPTFANEKMNLWKWKWQGSKIEVHLSYQFKFSRTTVTFFNDAI
jgi:hypothetical protein